MSDPPPTSEQLSNLEQRLELLERENQRLRERLEPLTGPYNPCFNPTLFLRAFRRVLVPITLAMSMIPAIAVPLLVMAKINLPNTHIGPIPVFDFAGTGSGVPGIGLGIFAFGGASIGVFAFGGLAIGIVAIGGGAVGLIAFGGGSLGLIAVGGGACGYIAVGGSGFGKFALGQRAFGKYALGLNRQDPEAIEFFVRYFPGLRAAVTTAMPVIPLNPS
jgi:hypothetical protein